MKRPSAECSWPFTPGPIGFGKQRVETCRPAIRTGKHPRSHRLHISCNLLRYLSQSEISRSQLIPRQPVSAARFQERCHARLWQCYGWNPPGALRWSRRGPACLHAWKLRRECGLEAQRTASERLRPVRDPSCPTSYVGGFSKNRLPRSANTKRFPAEHLACNLHGRQPIQALTREDLFHRRSQPGHECAFASSSCLRSSWYVCQCVPLGLCGNGSYIFADPPRRSRIDCALLSARFQAAISWLLYASWWHWRQAKAPLW